MLSGEPRPRLQAAGHRARQSRRRARVHVHGRGIPTAEVPACLCGRSWSPRGAARELSGFPCHRKLRRAQITIRGIFLDANPFITSYASATNKYHSGYYGNYVRTGRNPTPTLT